MSSIKPGLLLFPPRLLVWCVHIKYYTAHGIRCGSLLCLLQHLLYITPNAGHNDTKKKTPSGSSTRHGRLTISRFSFHDRFFFRNHQLVRISIVAKSKLLSKRPLVQHRYTKCSFLGLVNDMGNVTVRDCPSGWINSFPFVLSQRKKQNLSKGPGSQDPT